MACLRVFPTPIRRGSTELVSAHNCSFLHDLSESCTRYARLGRMKLQDPLYADFTWGAGGSTADLTLELTKEVGASCAGDF